MKRTRFILLFLYTFSSLAGKINIATGEWYPFISEDSPGNGCIARLVRAAYKKVGYTVNYVFMPWDGVMKRVRLGKHDASVYWYKNDEREKYFHYSKNHLRLDRLAFFKLREDSTTFREWEDLKNKEVILNDSYYYPQDFLNYAKANNIKLIKLDYDEQMVKFFERGRGDILVMDEKLFVNLVNKNKINRKKFIKTKIDPFEEKGYIIFPKINNNSVELRNLFDKGFEKLEKSKIDKFIYDDC